jgi:hypothetical protein
MVYRYAAPLEVGTLQYNCKGTGGATPAPGGNYAFTVDSDKLPCVGKVTMTQSDSTQDTWYVIIHQPLSGGATPRVHGHASALSTMVAAAVAGANSSGPNFDGLMNMALMGDSKLTSRLADAYARVNLTFNPPFSQGGQWLERLIGFGTASDTYDLDRMLDRVGLSTSGYRDMIKSFAFTAPHTAYADVHANVMLTRAPELRLYQTAANACSHLRLNHDYHVFTPRADTTLDNLIRTWRFKGTPGGGWDVNEMVVDETLPDGTKSSFTMKQTGTATCEYTYGITPYARHVVVSPTGVIAGVAQTSGVGTTTMLGIPAVPEHSVAELSTAATGNTAGWYGQGFHFDTSNRKYYGRAEKMLINAAGSIISHEKCWQNNWSLGNCPTVSGETVTKRAGTSNLFNVTRGGVVERVLGLYRAASGQPLLVALDAEGGMTLFGYPGALTRPAVASFNRGWMMTAASETGFVGTNDVTGWTHTVSSHVSPNYAVWSYKKADAASGSSVNLNYTVDFPGTVTRAQGNGWSYSRDLPIPVHNLTVHVEANSGGTPGRKVVWSVFR